MMIGGVEIKRVMDHVEVYYKGEFLFSADTVQEAQAELRTGEYDKFME